MSLSPSETDFPLGAIRNCMFCSLSLRCPLSKGLRCVLWWGCRSQLGAAASSMGQPFPLLDCLVAPCQHVGTATQPSFAAWCWKAAPLAVCAPSTSAPVSVIAHKPLAFAFKAPQRVSTPMGHHSSAIVRLLQFILDSLLYLPLSSPGQQPSAFPHALDQPTRGISAKSISSVYCGAIWSERAQGAHCLPAHAEDRTNL